MSDRNGSLRAFWKRWCGPANLVTMTRIPLTLLILPSVLYPWVKDALPSWYPWFFGVTALGIFTQGVLAQALAMIADGLDGLTARYLQKGGATSEGQFLDQFMDKVFIWTVWGAISFVFYDSPASIVYWYAPSVYLLILDIRSCWKHWRNYIEDRRKQEFDRSHGAVNWGKAKFWFQNFVVCLNMAALSPGGEVGFPEHYNRLVDYCQVATWTQSVSVISIFTALALARASLRKRGVLPPKKKKQK